MSGDLDALYGVVRSPTDIPPWEVDRSPISLSVLDPECGRVLADYVTTCQPELLSGSAASMTFLWVMEPDGTVKVAIEELAELPDGQELTGHPRRRNFPTHPAEEKKLGHPCLSDAGEVRIAGELFLDRRNGSSLEWHVNTNSGRYCRQEPPNGEQNENIRAKFEQLIERDVHFDSLEEA